LDERPTVFVASVVTDEIADISEAIVVAMFASAEIAVLHTAVAIQSKFTSASLIVVVLHVVSAIQLAVSWVDEASVISQAQDTATLRATCALLAIEAIHSIFALTVCASLFLLRKKKKLIRFYPGI
jgi:hypothetical protein